MHGEEGRKGGRDGMGMRRQGCRGPPGTRRLEGEQCDSSRPARGLISGQEDGCGGGRWLWPREGQMVNDMTGFFFFFFSLLGSGTCCPYQVSLAHNILPGEKELKRERLVHKANGRRD